MGRPFDPKLASLYAQFVQAAYTMYHSAPQNLTPPQSADFPAGYRLAAWIQMQDFILGSTAPLFYGFVAQSEVASDQFVVAIRGTSNGVEWWDDFNALEKTPFKVPGCGSVGEGFARIYDTLEVIERPTESQTFMAAPRSMRPAGSFSKQVAALVESRKTSASGPPRLGGFPISASVEITGHSLGAALATLYTMENAHAEKIHNPALCTFASPLVGDATFASVFNGLNLTSWRVVNEPDLVPKIPPAIFGFVHVESEVEFDSIGEVAPSFGCWHSLATYLSLIDPTKQPDPSCQLASAGVSLARPDLAALVMPAGSVSPPAARVFRPIAIDLYQGDDVEDTPGPLGGFSRVKANGIAFLLHKASQGVRGVDSRYRARRAAWMDGIPVSVTDVDGEILQLVPRFAAYHYFMGEDPEAEALHFLETAQLQPGDDAVVDWEQSRGSATPPSADSVDAFCNVVEKSLGFPIIVYSGNVAKELLKGVDARFAKRRLWLCQYNSSFKIQESWSYPWLWQNNGDDSGPGPHTIPGIKGDCDNSTIAPPMTVKRLYAEWGGGSQVSTARAASLGRSASRNIWSRGRPPGFTGTQRKIARYGWKPDLPDQRDYSYSVPAGVVQNMSAVVDLRPQCPPVYDQGQIGSCTANAIAAALEFDMMRQKLPAFTPSRLFIYYNERSIEGTVGSDAGAFIRDGIKSVASQGDCPESEWTYDGSAAQLPGNVFAPGAKAALAPSPQCYDDAVRHKALNYFSVDQNLADMKGCLASGYPFVFGFTVYQAFESEGVARSGIVPMPTATETMLGGHAVLAVGYDDSKNMFIVRNSWGPSWGVGGYFYMPYAYLLDDNLASDFWTVRVVD